MTREQFAQALGFSSYEMLVQESEAVIREGDVNWYVTQLPDGRWGAWDESELAMDRVMRFSTRGEAIAFHLGGFAEKCKAELI